MVYCKFLFWFIFCRLGKLFRLLLLFRFLLNISSGVVVLWLVFFEVFCLIWWLNFEKVIDNICWLWLLLDKFLWKVCIVWVSWFISCGWLLFWLVCVLKLLCIIMYSLVLRLLWIMWVINVSCLVILLLLYFMLLLFWLKVLVIIFV